MATSSSLAPMTSYVEQPSWRTAYSEDTSALLRSIPKMFEVVNQCIKDPEMDEYVRGFILVYRAFYITECNRGEKTGTRTMPETELALEQPSLIHFESDQDRAYKKTQNLLKAIQYIFGMSLVVKELKHQFLPELAKEINRLIGDGLFTNAGSYRLKDAKPSGYDYYYITPSEIDNEMRKLFENMNSTEINDQNWFSVGAEFLERFLKIHPFSNGNGRTARILLSALLIKHTIVPLFLFHGSNEAYLNSLQEAHEYENFSLLNSFIIESTHQTLRTFLVLLDLKTED